MIDGCGETDYWTWSLTTGESFSTATTEPRTVFRRSVLSWHMSTGREIRLIEEDDGGWSAIDEDTGVASQGDTRREALANLDEAVELTLEARAEASEAPTPDAPWFDA